MLRSAERAQGSCVSSGVNTGICRYQLLCAGVGRCMSHLEALDVGQAGCCAGVVGQVGCGRLYGEGRRKMHGFQEVLIMEGWKALCRTAFPTGRTTY